MDESDPFQNSCVLVNDLTLFKVHLGVWLDAWLLDEGLVQVHWVEDVVFEFEQSVYWSAQEFGMAESVGDELVLFFGFHFDVVFVAFGVKVFGDGSVGSFVFPLLDVLKVVFFVPGGVGNKSVFVGEDDFLVVDVESVESEVFEFGFDGAVFVDVGVNTLDTVLVGSVKITDGLPYFALHFQVILEIVNDCVVFFDLGFVVVLIEFGVDVLW